MRFGVYEWNRGSQERKLRPSAALLHTWFTRLKERCPKLSGAWERREEQIGEEDNVIGKRLVAA
jgi:hypothetical protein